MMEEVRGNAEQGKLMENIKKLMKDDSIDRDQKRFMLARLLQEFGQQSSNG